MKPIHLGLSLLGGIFCYSAYVQVTKPVLPEPPSPNVLGFVPVKLGNAGPDPIDVVFTSKTSQAYHLKFPRCPTCKIEINPSLSTACSADTVYKDFALRPELYRVEVYNLQGALTYSSKLDLRSGTAYNKGVCLVKTNFPQNRDLPQQSSQP